jgi:cell division protein FtsN
VIYLLIMLAVAVVGIGSLLFQQRRQRAHLESVEGFQQSLKAISPEAAPGPFSAARVSRRPAKSMKVPGRRVSLDPARREAARRRLEARRRAQSRSRLAQAPGSRQPF